MTEQCIMQHLKGLNINQILSDIEEKKGIKEKGLAEKISTGELSAIMNHIIEIISSPVLSH